MDDLLGKKYLVLEREYENFFFNKIDIWVMKVDNVVILVFKYVVDINLEDDVLVYLDEKER